MMFVGYRGTLLTGRDNRRFLVSCLVALLVTTLWGSMLVSASDAGIDGGDNDRLKRSSLSGENSGDHSARPSQHILQQQQQQVHTGRNDPPIVLFLTCVVSHVTILPAMSLFWKRRWMYELCLSISGFIASFMYHACQAFNGVFFLTELKWHILDNIFVICNFANLFIYIAMIRDARIEFGLKFSSLFVALITQIRAPWEISHTIVPIALYGAIPLFSLIFTKRTSPTFDVKNAAFGTALLVVAVPFFVLGLDDDNDPYRMFHGLWHLVVGISAYYMWKMIKNPLATNVQSIAYADNSYNTLVAGRIRSEV